MEIFITSGIAILSMAIIVVFIVKNFIQKEITQLKLQRSHQKIEITLPLRLQALERLALLLERVSPNQMVMRLNRQNMSAQEFNIILIGEIKAEFNHNLSQQIYLEKATWDEIRKSVEEIIAIINMAVQTLDEKATSHDLARKIIETLIQQQIDPIGKALDMIRNETNTLFS